MNKHTSCSSVLVFVVCQHSLYLSVQPSVVCYIQHSLYLSVQPSVVCYIQHSLYLSVQPSMYCQLLNVRVSGTSPDSQPLPMYGSGLHILNKALGESQKGMSISHVQNRQINHCTLHLRCTLHSLIDYHMYH